MSKTDKIGVTVCLIVIIWLERVGIPYVLADWSLR